MLDVGFLLNLLNINLSEGPVPDDRFVGSLQEQITQRLIGDNLVAEYHPDQKRWYVHIFDRTGIWEE